MAMSNEHAYQEALWGSDLPAPQRAIAHYLLARAWGKPALTCWPSAQTVARQTGYSLRATKTALAGLRKAGWLVDTGRRHGPTGRVIEHRLSVPANGARRASNGAGGAPLMVQEVHLEDPIEEPKEDNMSEQHASDPTEEPSMTDNPTHPSLFPTPPDRLSGETKTEGQTTEAGPTIDPPQKAQPDPWKETMTLWTTLAKEQGRRGTPYQRTSPTGKALQARIGEHGADAVAQVLRWYWRSYSERATFLRDGGYTLTTLMRPDNCVAYLELAHRDPASQPRGPAKVTALDEGRARLRAHGMPTTEEERNAWRMERARRQFAPRGDQ